MTYNTCPYNPRLGCDCGLHEGYLTMEDRVLQLEKEIEEAANWGAGVSLRLEMIQTLKRDIKYLRELK
jgi:hypothetical protein